MNDLKLDRIFVPLASNPYDWFLSGKKRWELRRYGRQYTEKHIKIGKVVELRCGYNNRKKAVWGIIEDIQYFGSLSDVFQNINYKEIIPISENIEDAKELTGKILNLNIHDDIKLIAFKINKFDDSQYIEMAAEFYEMIISGQKRTTIRKGKRDYKIGKGIIVFNNKNVIINILGIKHIRLTELSYNEINNDGFRSIEELKASLYEFYGELDLNETMTLVSFELDKGDMKNAD